MIGPSRSPRPGGPGRAAWILCLMLLASLVTACGSETAIRRGAALAAAPGGPSVAPDSLASQSVVPSPVATPKPGASATPKPEPPRTPFGFRAKGMSHEVMAFVNYWHVTHAMQHLDFGAVSTIAFFSVGVNGQGRLARSSGAWKSWRGRDMDRLIARAHKTGTKVVLTVEAFAWTTGQAKGSRALLVSPERRRRLAREVANEVVARGVDGVNVDFEPIPKGQKQNFTHFIRELRAELDRARPGYQLTYCSTGHSETYDISALVKPGAADAVYIMGYHYRGNWTEISGSLAPLGGPRYDVVDTVRTFRKYMPAGRIILGVPLYGHLWPVKGPGLDALTTGGGVDLHYPRALDLARRYGLRYDRTEQVAWIVFREKGGWRQLYFDDARALEAKWRFVKQQRLLGTGVWAIGFEADRREIYTLLRKHFSIAGQ